MEVLAMKKALLKSSDYPLAQAVLKGEVSEEGVEAEFECEFRYLPKQELSLEKLQELSGGHKRKIEQCYIKTDAGTVRLRKTLHDSEEGEMYRIAHKHRIAESEGKTEYQMKFKPDDPRAREFEELWKRHDWNIVEKTRYYIPWKLPNGNMCEIHYDIHHDLEDEQGLAGFARIEVEFKSDADAAYVRGYHGYQPVLPDWIGQEVTNDKRYNGKTLAKDGLRDDS